MFEALQYYQSLAQRFQSQLLTGPGILIILIGLCIWLAGLRWRKIMGVLAGISIAITAGLAFDGSSAMVAAVAVVGALTGAFFDKAVLGVFGSAVAAGIVLLVISYAGASSDVAEAVKFYDANEAYDSSEIVADDFISGSSYPMWPEYETADAFIPAPVAAEITVGMARHLSGKAEAGFSCCCTAEFAAAGFAAIITAVVAMAVPRLFISVISAVLGSVFIFAGMIMLLFYKGSEPISYIAQRPQFYSLVFLAMVIFGTVIQLVLSPARLKIIKPKPDKPENTKH